MSGTRAAPGYFQVPDTDKRVAGYAQHKRRWYPPYPGS